MKKTIASACCPTQNPDNSDSTQPPRSNLQRELPLLPDHITEGGEATITPFSAQYNKSGTTVMSDYHKPDGDKLQELRDVANKLRIHSIESTQAAKSGHPTSCCSAAEVMSVLFFHTMRYKPAEPRDPSSDRFIISKGHAAPVLYAAWAEAGLFPASNLLSLRKIDSELEGHPTPNLNFVDVATGSLGQGLSCAAGMAYTGKYLDKAGYRVYCLIGDGESAEGSIWEAMSFASNYKLDNLVAIFDVNRLGQSQETALQHDMEVYQRRAEAFGWKTMIVDGHNVEDLCKAFHSAANFKDKPTCILAKTLKGKGCPNPPIENENGWHGKPLGDHTQVAVETLKKSLKNPGQHKLIPPKPLKDDCVVQNGIKVALAEPPAYKLGDMVATRLAYGIALVKLGQNCDKVIALDGDVKNSTFSDKFRAKFPDRFIECFIAEQNLVGVAIGCGTRGRTIPFVSTFACFLSRAYDQIRMGAISQTNVNFCGSHAGCSIGEDGPSQMALEDIAMFRAVPGSTVFYPSDAVSCERACELAANTKGVCFIRTSRPNTPVVYGNEERFEVGKAKVLRKADGDKATVVGAGVTLNEAIKASDLLAKEGITITVIDAFTIKPLDGATIIAAGKKSGGKIITVEDHYPEGGLGEAVCHAVATQSGLTVKTLCVPRIPRSGPSAVLMNMFGIDYKCIADAVKSA